MNKEIYKFFIEKGYYLALDRIDKLIFKKLENHDSLLEEISFVKKTGRFGMSSINPFYLQHNRDEGLSFLKGINMIREFYGFDKLRVRNNG